MAARHCYWILCEFIIMNGVIALSSAIPIWTPCPMELVSIHAPLRFPRLKPKCTVISSTHLAQSAISTSNRSSKPSPGSIHAFVKSATGWRELIYSSHCFNPPLAKSATPGPHGDHPAKRVSIHALVKSTTRIFRLQIGRASVSIHALVKSATKALCSGQMLSLVSIHALVKSATSVSIFDIWRVHVSIHALVKSATLLRQSRDAE